MIAPGDAAADKASLRRACRGPRGHVGFGADDGGGASSGTTCSKCRRCRPAGRSPPTTRSARSRTPTGLIFALWKRGSYVVLPVLLPDGDLDWASYEGPDSLAPGPRGLLQPVGAGARARHRRPARTLVLVPALAVDAQREQARAAAAGRYDRALARVGDAGADDRAALRRRTAAERARRAARPRGSRGRAPVARHHWLPLRRTMRISDPCAVILSSLLLRVLIWPTELVPPGRNPCPPTSTLCTECGGQLEAVQKFTDDPLTVCTRTAAADCARSSRRWASCSRDPASTGPTAARVSGLGGRRRPRRRQGLGARSPSARRTVR